MPSKDKFGKFWVFRCVANHAQHLNICRVGSKAGFRAVRFNMVALQFLLASALFAFATFLHNLTNYFSAVVFSFACSAIPFWMVGAFWHSRFCTTGCGAVLSCSAIAFSNLKPFAASFAHPVKNCFGLLWMKFVRTRAGASVGFSSNVRVGANKLDTTGGACQNAVSAPFNFSLEFGHG